MVKLSEIYIGAQDAYIYNEKVHFDTYKTEYIETRRSVAKKETKVYYEETPAELVEANEYFMQSPFTRMSEYLEILEKYKDYQPIVRYIDRRSKVEISKDSDESKIGYTGLRFKGDPMSVRSITVEIGGQRMDKIYPSATGQFDSMNLFEVVIPNPIFHKTTLWVEFEEGTKAETEVEVEWDLVNILDRTDQTVYLFSSTQFTGTEEIHEGESVVNLNFNHPVEMLTIYTEKSVERMILCIDSQNSFHVPYAGFQNNKYIYKYAFQMPINFSRIEKPVLKIKSATKNTVGVFAKTKNVLRVMQGMAGLAFSK